MNRLALQPMDESTMHAIILHGRLALFNCDTHTDRHSLHWWSFQVLLEQNNILMSLIGARRAMSSKETIIITKEH